jgi:hypothetical protein
MQGATGDDLHSLRDRQGRIIGAAAAMAAVVPFAFPSGAHPLQSLALAGFFLFVPAIAVSAIWTIDRPRALGALGSLGAIAAGALAAWSIWRWRSLYVPIVDAPGAPSVWVSAPGRPIVIAYLSLAVALAAGAALGVAGRTLGPGLARTFRWGLILAAILFAAHGLYQRFWGYDLDRAALEAGQSGFAMSEQLRQSLLYAFETKRIGGRLGGGNLFAALLAVLAVFALSEMRRPFGGARFVLAAGAYLLCAFAIVLTGSRGGLLTLLLVTAGGVLILRRRAPISGSTIAAPLAVFLVAGGARAAGLLERLGDVATIRERLYYWSVARQVWAMDAALGAGPGAFVLYYPRFKPPTAQETQFAHSWFYQTGAELGWVGLALFGALIAAVAMAAWRARSEAEAPWFALACAALLFNGMFEYTFQTREFLMLFGLLGGWLAGSAAKPANGPIALGRVAVGGVAIAAALLPAIWMTARHHLAQHHGWAAREFAGEAARLESTGDAEGAAIAWGATADRLDAAIGWAPDESRFIVGLAGIIARDRMRLAFALTLLENAQRRNPLSPRVRLEQARIYREGGETERALAKMDEAVALYPFGAAPRLERADLRLAAGDEADAREDLEFIRANGLPVAPTSVEREAELRKQVGLDGAG